MTPKLISASVCCDPSGGHKRFVLKLPSSGTRIFALPLSASRLLLAGGAGPASDGSWGLFGHKWAPIRPTTP